MKIERSRTGVYRLPLWGDWAVGLGTPGVRPSLHFHRYHRGGWSLCVLWFHVGWKRDRKNWSHWGVTA